jgi:hypothetical protein
MTDPTTPAQAPTPEPAPIWEDFLEIFYAPRAVFERRKAAGFGIPLLVLVVAMTAAFYAGRNAMEPIFDAEFTRGLATAAKQNPNLTPEQLEKGRAFAWGFAPVAVTGYALIAPMLIGVLLWLAGKAVEARQELGAACMVATYALYPRLLEALLNILQALLLGDDRLTSHFALQLGPARFLDHERTSLVLLTLLGRLDLITLWCTALLAVGLSVTGRIPLARAGIAAGVVWLLAGLWPLYGAFRAS